MNPGKMKDKFEKDIKTIISDLDRGYQRSLASPFGNVSYHIQKLKQISIYIRIRTKAQQRFGKPVLIISTVNVLQPGKGMFTELQIELKKYCEKKQWVLMVENVLTIEFKNYLIRQNFQQLMLDGDSGIYMIWLYDLNLLNEA